MRRALRPLLILAVLGGAAALGFRVSTRLAPERLHGEVEAWLARVTHAPVEMASLRLVVGFPVRLEGTGLRLYDGALTAEQASARIDVLSLLLGRPRLTRLRLDGAHLTLTLAPGGTSTPPWFRPPERPHPEPSLAPLRVIEGGIRFLLGKPLLADVLVVRRSRLTLRHPSPEPGRAPITWSFAGLNGRLLHSRLFGDARLFLRVRVLDAAGGERGVLEVQGSRDAEGTMDAALAATAFDLRTLAPYLRALRPDARLVGSLDGVASFRTTEPDAGDLDIDFAVRGFSADFDAPGDARPPLRADDLSLRLRVGFDPRTVALRDMRIGAGELDFGVDARFDRPLSATSRTSLTFSLAALKADAETARSAVEWLPLKARPRFASVAERLRSGRLAHAELAGTTTLARWGALFAGRLDELPDSIGVSFSLEDVSVQVDDANRLDHLRGRLSLADGTLELDQVRAELNGAPLPVLELRIEGVRRLLAVPAESRGETRSASALVGVTPLFEMFRPPPDAAPQESSAPPRIDLHLEHLYHPALLWPVHDVALALQLERETDGIHFDVKRCEWAGVRIDGVVDWQVHPERRVSIRVAARESETAVEGGPDAAQPSPAATQAGSPALHAAERVASAPAPLADEEARLPWASGSFEVGAMDGGSWHQREARGRFVARGAALELEDVEIALLPSGHLTGAARLDLGQSDRVPYEARLALREGDVAALLPGRDVLKGRLDAQGRLGGTLLPGRTWLHDADGELSAAVSGGTLARSVPPVVALALASSSLNPFAGRDQIRVDRLEAAFQLESGRMHTDALELDGPDLRVFASGSFDWGRAPARVDAEVALFLFRQLDRALELIPLVNVLLLGNDQNLVAAYFELVGPWNDPVAVAKPLRTLEEGPTAVITQGIPNVMKRGMKALGGLFGGGAPMPAPAPVPEAQQKAPAPVPEAQQAAPAQDEDAPTAFSGPVGPRAPRGNAPVPSP